MSRTGHSSARSANGAIRVTVDPLLCRGEALCERICPQVFRVVDGVAKASDKPLPRAAEACCREAEKNCPTGAIRIEKVSRRSDVVTNRK